MIDAVEQTMQSRDQSSNVRGTRSKLMNVKFNDNDDVAIPEHIQSDSSASIFDFTDSSAGEKEEEEEVADMSASRFWTTDRGRW